MSVLLVGQDENFELTIELHIIGVIGDCNGSWFGGVVGT